MQQSAYRKSLDASNMKSLIFLTALVALSSANVVKRAAQSPGVWSALDQLRGKAKLSIEDISALLTSAKPGQDYPNLASIPEGNFDCASVKPGFYADVDTKCQGKSQNFCRVMKLSNHLYVLLPFRQTDLKIT